MTSTLAPTSPLKTGIEEQMVLIHARQSVGRTALTRKNNEILPLIEVLDRILDKGIVIDAWVRVSLYGIDFLMMEARVVVASLDTYLNYGDMSALTDVIAAPR